MNWSDLFVALGLAAVIEGILYAAFPDATKQALGEFMSLPTETRRKIALCIAGVGLFIVWLVRG
jgi:uncharacterized protein YjeT (DUF2065 family)